MFCSLKIRNERNVLWQIEIYSKEEIYSQRTLLSHFQKLKLVNHYCLSQWQFERLFRHKASKAKRVVIKETCTLFCRHFRLNDQINCKANSLYVIKEKKDRTILSLKNKCSKTSSILSAKTWK